MTNFLEILQESYPGILQRALDENYIVCVPSSLQGITLSKPFISNLHSVDHLILPSPYLENMFQTMTGKTIYITKDTLQTHIGYTHSFSLQKLGEVNTHDSRGRVYKQVLISGSLDDSPIKNCSLPVEPIYKFYSAKEYEGFLEVILQDSQAAVMYSAAFSQHFNKTFIAFKDSAKTCYNKVKIAIQDLKKLVLRMNEFKSGLSTENLLCVSELAESCILPKIYEKLFSCLVSFQTEAQDEFANHAQSLLAVSSYQKWGLDPAFHTLRFPRALQVFLKMDSMETCWEKLDIMIDFAKVFEKECKKHLAALGRGEAWELSADSYIPLLVYFLCMHRPERLMATLVFIQEFSLTSDTSGRRYHFTNMIAAVHTIKQYVGEIQMVGEEEARGIEAMLIEAKRRCDST